MERPKTAPQAPAPPPSFSQISDEPSGLTLTKPTDESASKLESEDISSFMPAATSYIDQMEEISSDFDPAKRSEHSIEMPSQKPTTALDLERSQAQAPKFKKAEPKTAPQAVMIKPRNRAAEFLKWVVVGGLMIVSVYLMISTASTTFSSRNHSGSALTAGVVITGETFKIYTTGSGLKIGVVTGSMQVPGPTDVSMLPVQVSLVDYSGNRVFSGEFMPTSSIPPDKIVAIASAADMEKLLKSYALKGRVSGTVPVQAIFPSPPVALDRYMLDLKLKKTR